MHHLLAAILTLALFTPCKNTLFAQPTEIPDTLANNKIEKLFFFYLGQQLDHEPRNDSARLAHDWDSVTRWIERHGTERMQVYNNLFLTVFASYRLEASGKADTFLLHRSQRFENSAYTDVKAAWSFFLGHHFYTVKNFDLSFRLFLESDYLMQQFGYENMPLVNHYRYYFFRLHYQVGDYPAALRFYQDIRKTYGAEGDGRAAFDYNNIGVTFLKMGELEKAKSFFEKSIKYARLQHLPVYWGIASGNFGNALRLQGRYRQALPYLYFDVATNEKDEPPNSAITCVYIANCLLHLDSIAKSKTYLDHALTLQPDWEWSSFGLIYYETRALYSKKMGQYEKATNYQDSLLALRDKLRAQNNVALFKDISSDFTVKRNYCRIKVNWPRKTG